MQYRISNRQTATPDLSSAPERAKWEFGQRYPAPAGCATAYIVTSAEALAARAEAEQLHQVRPMEMAYNMGWENADFNGGV
ncbi:hypothetical protein [Xanthomonas phage XPV3]|uniref:Uncharacterized protein n=1 Tax=Xanthomonas phage XPV1 TaxID=2099860 RepID=A0A3S7I680_9CAUD|nr:hypothetical protein KEM12_gp08 [Xanthomonas phage XPV1]AVO24172.1 hypothetical protein [Xanthomonas phage XPV1]AVO24363.1 hypothetical protein [Xanthomonas phage XPV3]